MLRIMNTVERREELTEQQKAYARYLARGKKDVEGNEYTMAEFAKLIGVNPNTLYEWKHKKQIQEAILEASLAELSTNLPALNQAIVMKAMGQKPKKNSPGDVSAYLAIMRQFSLLRSDKQDVTHGGEVGITINTLDYKSVNDNNSV